MPESRNFDQSDISRLEDLLSSTHINFRWYTLDEIEEMVCHGDKIAHQIGARYIYMKNPNNPRLCWQSLDYPSGGLDRDFLLKNPVNAWRIL